MLRVHRRYFQPKKNLLLFPPFRLFPTLRTCSGSFQRLRSREKGCSARRSAPLRVALCGTPQRHNAPFSPEHGGQPPVRSLLRTRAIQAKIAISQSGDPEEREADRIAEQVVSQKLGPTHIAPNGATCSKCEERDKLTRKETGSHMRRGAFANDSQIALLHSGGNLCRHPCATFSSRDSDMILVRCECIRIHGRRNRRIRFMQGIYCRFSHRFCIWRIHAGKRRGT